MKMYLGGVNYGVNDPRLYSSISARFVSRVPVRPIVIKCSELEKPALH